MVTTVSCSELTKMRLCGFFYVAVMNCLDAGAGNSGSTDPAVIEVMVSTPALLTLEPASEIGIIYCKCISPRLFLTTPPSQYVPHPHPKLPSSFPLLSFFTPFPSKLSATCQVENPASVQLSCFARAFGNPKLVIHTSLIQHKDVGLHKTSYEDGFI